MCHSSSRRLAYFPGQFGDFMEPSRPVNICKDCKGRQGSLVIVWSALDLQTYLQTCFFSMFIHAPITFWKTCCKKKLAGLNVQTKFCNWPNNVLVRSKICSYLFQNYLKTGPLNMFGRFRKCSARVQSEQSLTPILENMIFLSLHPRELKFAMAHRSHGKNMEHFQNSPFIKKTNISSYPPKIL